ncbi:hypothetical protein IscW_ISCW002896 [Ixodes scapularis]|uniref:Uncharacterized protein n=1 Tax=Ixodes scapularis TaxID=6945 RepID=B7P7G4_IXOSC|nr:hypothetical protein IscW_ISCW002896 [Ixodes scapularis]|eukprot:XP_002399196.1 hypothetical protein IscW_ISCW002896 [Ixodes scapularis]
MFNYYNPEDKTQQRALPNGTKKEVDCRQNKNANYKNFYKSNPAVSIGGTVATQLSSERNGKCNSSSWVLSLVWDPAVIL